MSDLSLNSICDRDTGGDGSDLRHLLGSGLVKEIEFRDNPGVYFLFDGENLVYVGQSACPECRVRSHRRSKTFDRAFVLRCPKSELDSTEAYFIGLFSPKYNGGDLIPRLTISRAARNAIEKGYLGEQLTAFIGATDGARGSHE